MKKHHLLSVSIASLLALSPPVFAIDDASKSMEAQDRLKGTPTKNLDDKDLDTVFSGKTKEGMPKSNVKLDDAKGMKDPSGIADKIGKGEPSSSKGDYPDKLGKGGQVSGKADFADKSGQAGSPAGKSESADKVGTSGQLPGKPEYTDKLKNAGQLPGKAAYSDKVGKTGVFSSKAGNGSNMGKTGYLPGRAGHAGK